MYVYPVSSARCVLNNMLMMSSQLLIPPPAFIQMAECTECPWGKIRRLGTDVVSTGESLTTSQTIGHDRQ